MAVEVSPPTFTTPEFGLRLKVTTGPEPLFTVIKTSLPLVELSFDACISAS